MFVAGVRALDLVLRREAGRAAESFPPGDVGVNGPLTLDDERWLWNEGSPGREGGRDKSKISIRHKRTVNATVSTYQAPVWDEYAHTPIIPWYIITEKTYPTKHAPSYHEYSALIVFSPLTSKLRCRRNTA